MDKKILYRIAYRILENSTPLRYDCGLICGKACCKGEDDRGMYLFPSEETPSIKTVPSDFRTPSGKTVNIALCGGKCERRFRPLGCRIFPYSPYISQNGRLEIIMDPRAVFLCPLVMHSSVNELNPFFIRRVRKVFRLLEQDDEIRDFIQGLSEMFNDLKKINKLPLVDKM